MLDRASALRTMLVIRAFEERVADELRARPRARHAHLCIGQEAAAVGAIAALGADDRLISTHRCHGHAIARGADLALLFAEIFSHEGAPFLGRSGTMHLIDPDRGLLAATSIVGQSVPLAAGVAFAAQRLGTGRVCMGFLGDGAANQGLFHETLNLAALWKLPVVFVCENNGWAISTPVEEVTSVPSLAARAEANGVPARRVDGNDLDAVYAAAREAVDAARSGHGPRLLELVTYSLTGHSTAESGEAYRPRDRHRAWLERDPVRILAERLAAEDALGADDAARLAAEAAAEVDAAARRALGAPALHDAPEGARIHAACEPNALVAARDHRSVPGGEQTGEEAIYGALADEMRADPRILLLGEDVRDMVPPWFVSAFPNDRIRNLPISENGYLGLLVGASLDGLRPVVLFTFSDLLALCADFLVNFAAKVHYTSAGRLSSPIVLRAIAGGGGLSECAMHNQSLEGWWCAVPGLRVAMPADPYDAAGLLRSAIHDSNPVVLLESRELYRTKAFVPSGPYDVPFGTARVRRWGRDVTVVATGRAVFAAEEAAALLEERGIGAELLDPRSLAPLDLATLLRSVRKTQRALVVEEAPPQASVGSYIVSRIALEAGIPIRLAHVAGPQVPRHAAPALARRWDPDPRAIADAALRLVREGA